MEKPSKKAQKMPKWRSELIQRLMENNETIEPYKNMSLRETVIVICAELDVALVELIMMRLKGNLAQRERLLGIGDAEIGAVSTLAARTQLAFCLDILTEADFNLITILRKIRNIMAHHVDIHLDDPDLVKLVDSVDFALFAKLYDDVHRPNQETPTGSLEGMSVLPDTTKWHLAAVSILIQIRLSIVHRKMVQVPELARLARTYDDTLEVYKYLTQPMRNVIKGLGSDVDFPLVGILESREGERSDS